MTTTAVCPVCGNPQAQGLLDDACTTALERELGDVAAIVGELDTTLSKQARIGGGGSPGLARERTPIAVQAMDPIWVLGNVLTTWARDVAREDADCTCGHYDLPPHFHMTPCPIKVAHLARISLDRPIVTKPALAAARILLNSIDAIRRHPAVEELVDEITDAVRLARRTVDRPADRVYFGQCYAETPDPEGRMVTCLEEIWARPNARETTCKVCGVTHEVEERREWLLSKAEDMIVTPREASQYVGGVGHMTVGHQRIRNYLDRKRILPRPSADGILRLRLGDLLTVLREEGAKRSA